MSIFKKLKEQRRKRAVLRAFLEETGLSEEEVESIEWDDTEHYWKITAYPKAPAELLTMEIDIEDSEARK